MKYFTSRNKSYFRQKSWSGLVGPLRRWTTLGAGELPVLGDEQAEVVSICHGHGSRTSLTGEWMGVVFFDEMCQDCPTGH